MNAKKLIILLLLSASSPFANAQVWGENDSRTEERSDAGAVGAAGAKSGFFQTASPINYPTNATSWWHLLDIRHTNTTNNFAMQFSGSFFDQELYFRKTNNNATTAWSKILLENNGKLGLGTSLPLAKLSVLGTGTFSNSNIEAGADFFGSDYRNRIALGNTNSVLGGSRSSAILFYGKSTNGTSYQNQWEIGTDSHGNGTLDLYFHNVALGSSSLYINAAGDICIGTENSRGNKLSVNGKIRALEIKVESANWPDYVFGKDYQLPTLQETEEHIKLKGHLPGIPTAEEVKANGIDLGEMSAKLLKKIEELTMYMIEMKKDIEIKDKNHQKEIDYLKSKIK
ncbi:hypothetical protein [Pedobacter metabolipauper]|uniref:Uncharacterized protein n=1 Tax=Pedobacter metabolipauper TaxID=425513 RepID=A0A4R6SYN9_9SPHI|nr:hypothetical protein [Pedobacter metabolipauper]TDQ11556.1 hypothetical protein ATK78_0679 [Pedobacter metabolipauper]